jgi:hypothetical protein
MDNSGVKAGGVQAEAKPLRLRHENFLSEDYTIVS